MQTFNTSLPKSQVHQLCSWQCWNNLLTLITVLFYLCQRGETALHMAARAGQMEVVRCLLRNGALVDAMARVSQLSLFPLFFFFPFLRQTHFSLLHRSYSLLSSGFLPSFTLICATFLFFNPRRTRRPFTLPLVWEKQILSSYCYSIWLTQMLPPPTATPPCTFLPGRGSLRLLLCCWRLEPHIPCPQRWVSVRMRCVITFKNVEMAKNSWETNILLSSL